MTLPKQKMGTIQSPSFFQRPTKNLGSFLKQMSRNPITFISFLIVMFYLFLAVFGSSIVPYGFDEQIDDPDRCITSDNGLTRCRKLIEAPPSANHIFGTDSRGRDVLSRVVFGASETIGLPAIATIFSVILGTILGLWSGYLGGWFDELISRAVDSLLAIPALVLALVTVGTVVPALESSENVLVDTFGAVNIALIIVIVFLYTPIVTRVIRSATLNLRDRGYVEAAKLRGESTTYILFSEILPSVLPTLVVEASLRFSYAIFLVASLGYLGLGAQPPSAEWGRMVLDARANFESAPWTVWTPVGAIASLVIAVNLMADGLRRLFRNDDDR